MKAGEPFAQVQTSVLRDPSLSVTARLLYALLQSHAWQDGITWVEQWTLATELGKTVRTVHTALTDLEKRGLIEVERRKTWPWTNNYRLAPGSESIALWMGTGSQFPVGTGSELPITKKQLT